ncbi:MAG: hypothetical protein NT154_17145 [Verrucomicrobia bacterium]|nr:hypothetical protein [Verrucomicrobiota bacterium]
MLNFKVYRATRWVCLLSLLTVAARAEVFTVTLTAPSPVITQTPAGCRVKVAGFASATSPGQPQLPSQIFRIAVPPDIDWATLKVKTLKGQSQPLELSMPVAPTAPNQANAAGALPHYPAGAHIVDGRDMNIYSLVTSYPESPIRLVPHGQMRKWRIAQVCYNPVQWNPITGETQYWPEMQVELEYDRIPAAAGAPSIADDPLMADCAMDELAATTVVNFQQAAPWYTPSESAKADHKKSFVGDYLIVTANTIVSHTPKLQDFIKHKTALGHAVSVITETDYNSVTAPYPNYREDKIRQWLKTHYASWGFSYVLLIGNPTPDMAYPESIPMKMTWPRLNEDDNRESPTDMFFSDLTGNWNISGDGLFGNPDDCSTDGGVDLFPEVYVGRIPFYGSYPDLSSILQKIMDYDNQANVAWRKSILLPMSFSADGYDGAPLAEQMWDDYLKLYGFSRWRQYQQGHGACSLNSDYPSDQELRGGSVVSNRWAANPYGIVCWWGHGNVDIAVVGYGDYCWDGDLFKSSMTSVLNDEFPAFTFQCSCLNGYPENYHNLQYQLLLRGGIGTVGATRDSWFNTGYGYGDFNGAAPNAGIGYEYVKRLAAGNKAGPSLAWAKAAVIGDIGSDCDWWMNQFDFNLYGDPSSQINLAKEYFPLADNTPWHMTAVPRRYSFPVNSYSWAAVGMRPGSEDHDLRADTHVGLPSPYAVSDLPGITPEIVVANGHNLGSATHYAEVYFGDETPYTIEAENNADGLNLETWHSRSLRTNDVIDLTQATVTSGHIYEVTADVTSGSPDLMLFVFGPGRNVGSRSSYDRFSNTAGAGGTEALTYTTTASGSLGILVVNRTSVAGVYNLRVRDISPIASPTSVSATDGTASDRVTVTWSTVSGASYYRVYRNTANDTVGAVAVSGWITANSYADLTAEVGTRYYYWVSAALDNAGFRASLLDTLDTGYVQPATLVHDVKVTVTNDPSYYQFSETANYWVAVGVRQDNPADNWSLRLYTAPDFVTQQAASYYVVPVDFVAVDRNRAPNVLRGVQPYRVTGSNSATLEFDGAAEQLSLGITTNLNWLAGEVVKMRDISLTSATYRVTLTVTAGTADLDVALFSSSDGNYYRSREQYVARSTRPAGVPDTFYVTVTNTDWYGLCVWANDTNSATYRLEVVPVFAGLWEGDISDDWHTPGNWNNNAVPVAANDVTIPPRTPYSPRIYRGLAYCSNLTVQTSAKLTINTNELYMSGDAHIHGYLNMDSTLARFHLGGDMVWEPGSTATMLASARILITGDWYFEDGANVQLTSGYVEFEGARTSSIRCYDANCNLYNLNCSKYAPYYLGVSGLSTADLPINNLYIYNGTAFRSYSTHNVIIRGFMNNMGGAFQWANGGAVFTGNPGVVTLHPTPTSYFNDLVQNGTGPLVLGNAYTNYLRIAGDVTIASSAIDSASFQIAVGGNWTNGVGRPGFLCRTGAVTFNGVSSQYVYGSNVFYTVNDSRSGRGTLWLNDDLVVSNIHHVASIHGVKGRMNVIGSLDLNSTTAQFAVYTGGNVTTARLDQGGHLSLLGGQFFASDLFDNGLFGRYTINEGSATLQQNAAQYIDLNAIVDIANGTLRVVGGLGYSDWPYSLNGSLTMSGGVLDFDAAGIRINNGAYKLTNNITGGRIRTSGDLVVTNPTFNPPGGEVEFYGSTSRTLNLVTGSGLHSSIINKTAATVTASTNVVLSGDFTLQSGVFAAPTLMTVAGSWANSVGPAGFVEGVGTVAFNGAAAASILTDETFYNLTLSKTYTDFDALQLADGIHVTAGNNFTCTDGALEMSAASVLNVRGDVTLARGAGLNASAPNTAVYVGGYWVNQNTNHTIYNGFPMTRSTSMANLRSTKAIGARLSAVSNITYGAMWT